MGVGILSAVVTAHSDPVIKFLGGSPAATTTVTPPAPTPSLPTNSSSPTPPTIQLPVGLAFTKGSFTISDGGVDLDRNPAESGNVSTGTSEIIAKYPTGVYFYGAQETAQWQQPGVPTQNECHNAELSDGVAYLNYDLTSGQQARFCILTSEGRDAYVVIPGRTIISNSPFPAETFVWATKIPVS